MEHVETAPDFMLNDMGKGFERTDQASFSTPNGAETNDPDEDEFDEESEDEESEESEDEE